jgi:hypothetical protein
MRVLIAIVLGLVGFSLGASGAYAASATEDVCCILGKTAGDGAELKTEVTTKEECKGGEGFKVCSAMSDSENTCPTLEKKDLCGKCGFYWSGESCLAANPVDQAKKQLAEEEKKKKEAAPPAKQ